MAKQYRLILKDGKVQIGVIGRTGPICNVNAEKIREVLRLSAPVRVEYKPEYGDGEEGEAVIVTEVK